MMMPKMQKLIFLFLLATVAMVCARDHKEEIKKLFDKVKPSNDVIAENHWEKVKQDGVEWVHGVMKEDEEERERRDITEDEMEDKALETFDEYEKNHGDDDDDDDENDMTEKEDFEKLENRITKNVMQNLEENVEELADEVANDVVNDLRVKKFDEDIDDDIEVLDSVDDEEETRKNDPKPFWGRRRRRRRRRWFVRRRRTTKACPNAGCSSAIKHANGCGASGSNLNKFLLYKTTLKCACDKHDICYYCGQKWSVSRSSCDSSFLNDQKTLCRRKYAWWRVVSRNACLSWAYVQYSAVRVGGSKHYTSNSPSWCNESCVRNFGHNSKGVKK